MYPSLPPSDREFILQALKDSEERNARRIGIVLEGVKSLRVQQDAFEEHILKSVTTKDIKRAAISSGAVVSVIVGIIMQVIERLG